MATKCAHCPLRPKSMFQEMSESDVAVMSRFKIGEMQVDAGTPLLMQGSNSPQLFTALKGMGLRSKLLPNGDRQVINFVLPGDFLGLQAALTSEMGHSVEATTDMVLCVFNRSEMWNFFHDNPERAFALTWLAAVEEHFLGDALATVGQRTALQAMAWALAKLFGRGEALDLVKNGQMPLPYRQQDLADALGLSAVHTNRVLMDLRNRQIASWKDGFLSVSDWDALRRIAMLDDSRPQVRPLM